MTKISIFLTFALPILVSSASLIPSQGTRNASVPSASAVSQSVSDDGNERVMYSYAEANVEADSTPIVRQLTIVKGKDGQTRFAKNENGTIQTGKWNGPLPASPDVSSVNMVAETVKNATNEIIDPLTKINEQIGNSLQDYMQLLNF